MSLNAKLQMLNTKLENTKKIYKIEGMDCDSCATLLELDLEDAGIKNCRCSYPKKTLEIYEDHDEIKVVEIISKSGYSISNE